MGKAGRIRKNNERKKVDPLANVNNLDIGQNNAVRDTKILPVVKNLTSVNANERLEAISAVSNLLDDAVCRKLLLKEKIVPILMESVIHDSSPEAVVKGWGALKDLAMAEQYDVCMHMYRKDIMTPISAAIQKIQQTIRTLILEPASVDTMSKKLVWAYAENVTGLILAMIDECSGEVSKAALSNGAFAFIMGLLDPQCGAPQEVQDVAAQCLNVLTEDQDELVMDIAASDEVFVPALLKLRDAPCSSLTDPLLRTAAICGVFQNIAQILRASGLSEGQFDDSTTLSKLASIIRLVTSSKVDNPTQFQAIHALQIALEIVINFATHVGEFLESPGNAGEDSEAMDEDSDGMEVEENEEDENMQEEIAKVTADNREDDEGEESEADFVQTIISALVKTFTPLVSPLCMPDAARSYESLVHIRAIDCMNNIAWSVIQGLQPRSKLHKAFVEEAPELWTKSIVATVLPNKGMNEELAESLASLAWGLAKVAPSRVPVELDIPRAFMGMCKAARSMELQTKCVGLLGCLGRVQGVIEGGVDATARKIEVNKEIGIFLMTMLNECPSEPAKIAPYIEAANAVMDVYDDADHVYDAPVFVEMGFGKILQAAVGKFQAVVKRVDKRKEPEVRQRADEALENLRRFIKYKADEAKKR